MGDSIIFCDGACLGNPGPGGWASIIALKDRVIELGGAADNTTNNRMELTAVIEALKFLKKQSFESIVLCCDSKYVLEGAKQWIHGWNRNGWKTSQGDEVKNKDLWQELHELERTLGKKIEWKHVRGHVGIPGNERVDLIANSYASRSDVYLYEGSRREYEVNLDIVEGSAEKVAERKKLKRNKTANSANTVYLSLVGRKVYRDKTWKECEARVRGVAGAKYKKVSSDEEAEEVLKTWGV